MRAITGALLLLGTAIALPNNGITLLREERESTRCAPCRSTVAEVLGWIGAGDSREELVDKFTAKCANAGLVESVCRGATEINIDIVLWIIQTKNQTAYPLTPEEICGFYLYPNCDFTGEQFEWTLDLTSLGPKPAYQEPQLPPNGSPTMKVLQITDVHVDLMYLPGGNAMCGENYCCRSNQGPPASENEAAGYWGDYRDCDMPVHTFQNMLEDMKIKHPDISYVMFTGDIVDHATWSTSNQYNTNIITLIMGMIKEAFPGVPILPILGNHEANPSDVFSANKTEIPLSLSSKWLYEMIADVWGQVLPPSTQSTILHGGFYSMEVKPGLQAVVMNSMFCYNANWWLMYDNVDPSGELMWLAGELKAAEDANKKVHILIHQPSGYSDCMHQWSSQYRRIIDRFENTVVAQFHGHTHFDQFNVFYALEDPSRATNVAFTAGSGTSFSDVNMNYRTYTVDGDYPGSSFRVLDHETWFFNLTEANLAGPFVAPIWQKLYTFNEAYGTTSLLPAEMDELVKRMVIDTDLQQQYFRYYVKLGDPSLQQGCDPACIRDLLCRIVTTVQGDSAKCDEIVPKNV